MLTMIDEDVVMRSDYKPLFLESYMLVLLG